MKPLQERHYASTKCIIILMIIAFYSFKVSADSYQVPVSTHFAPELIASFAKKVETIVANKGARVFIIGRVGRPEHELPKGVTYTHVGFGVYSQIKTTTNQTMFGYTMYNLYQHTSNPQISDLVQDFPVDFFTGVHQLKAGIIIPNPVLQRRLLDVISSPTYAKLHNPKYSVISNPFVSEYQNCTEHVLDVINAAIYNTNDIDQLKINSKIYFVPHAIQAGPIKRLMAAMFAPDIALSDHGKVIKTSTFTTIAKYLHTYSLLQENFTIVN